MLWSFFRKKLDSIFNNKENGVFIELGANYGITESNTAFFEKYRKWKGILVEPSLKGYNKCKLYRPNSLCFNFACVSNDFKEEFIYGDFQDNHPMASVNGKRLNRSILTKVKTSTLEKNIDSCDFKEIHLLSLDTGGYELNILKGINLDKYRPKYMLIEIYTKDYNDIIDFLNNNKYKLISNFTNYNNLLCPNWDGTHNDYLFIDSFNKYK